MTRASIALAALGLAVACKASPDSGAGPSAAASATASAAPAKKGHVVLEEGRPEGDVESQVRDALAASTAAHRRRIVYVGATWCEPCQRFHKAAAQGELDAAFPDLDVLAFDVDRDGERLAAAGYVSKFIPLFALPALDGTASGKQVEGGIKGEGAVAYMTPRLQGLLGQ